MALQVAIDVSGLARHARTGVQNLYWAFVDAWAAEPALRERAELCFYDRSGRFHEALQARVGAAYRSAVPWRLPPPLDRAAQLLLCAPGLRVPDLHGAVNHVWNWRIYAPPGAPASITIPDVLPLEYPHWFSRRFRRMTERALDFARTRARYVFAISDDVRQRVAQASGLPAAGIRVVHPGIDPVWFAPHDPAQQGALLARYGLQAGRYVLSAGFLDPRKNLPRQLAAFAAASAGGGPELRYVLTGLPNAQSREVLQLIATPALRDRVVFLGYLPLAQLKLLVGASAALLYCSIAEGFGLPIIEAMAAGAPVITSTTTSMQEIAQGRARLVDPLSTEEIAAAIADLLGPGAPAARALEAANRRYAERFTIRNWLLGHLDAYASG